MFLPHRLLALELQRSNCWKEYIDYQRLLEKVNHNRLRIHFLQNCKQSGIIPRFLKFRIPNNGCFNDKSVYDFQRNLLHKEIIRAKNNINVLNLHLNDQRTALAQMAPTKCLPSIILHSRIFITDSVKKVQQAHSKKLMTLSSEQGKPLFSVHNTVTRCDLDTTPPNYIMDTLSLGPKNAVLDKFNPRDILIELD